MREEAFLRGMREQPDDNELRLVFADWLEENDDPRGELLRLTHMLTRPIVRPDQLVLETRLRSLLAANVQPIGPPWTNSQGMRFVWVPSGTFYMGSPPRELGRQDDETWHRVTLSRGFYMGIHPVTQAQWRAVMGDNPSRFQGDHRPVECVSWQDCQEFCLALHQKDGLEAGGPSPYRLPTEAEWEYACRAGTTSAFHFGETLATKQANYHANYAHGNGPAGNSSQETMPVGNFPINGWGLGDTHGNVYEWCGDWYASYPTEAVTDPAGQKTRDVRVLRGGSWHSLLDRCRSACRAWAAPSYRGSDVGCRICFRLDYDFTL